MNQLTELNWVPVAEAQFPSDWQSGELLDFLELQRGVDLPVQHRRDGNVPIFGSNGPLGFHDASVSEGPGVITGRSGTIGKVFYLEGEYWPLNTSLYVKDFKGNLPKFIYYMLDAIGLERFSTGTGVPTLNRNVAHKEMVAFPPISEQQKIAAILTAVDDKLDVIARRIDATRTLKQGLMQTLFSRGGGAQDAKGRWVPHTEFKDSALGTTPAAWEISSIGSLFDVVERAVKMTDEQVYRRVTVKRRYGGIELRDELRGSDIKVKSQFALQTDDFLISERQIVHGACGIVPNSLAGALVSNEYLVLKARATVDVRYFNYLVQQLKYAKYFMLCSQGVDIEKFLFKPKDWLKKLVPVPPILEQARIADVLATADEKLNALKSRQRELQNVKRGLMQKLITGEWRVSLNASATEP